jgi:hypothetical protein
LIPLIREYTTRRGSIDPTKKIFEFLFTLISEESRDVKHFHASSAGTCKRAQLLSTNGFTYEQSIDVRLNHIFDDGKWRHLKFQAMFYDMGILISAEEKISLKAWHLVGSIDVRVKLPNNPNVIVELKGTNDYQFQILKRSGKPLEHHLYQVLCYMLATDTPLGIILYENKNTQELLEFVINPDAYQAECAAIVHRYRILNKYRKKNQLSGFECTLLDIDSKFKYCNQKHNCLAQVKEGNYPKTERNKHIVVMYKNQLKKGKMVKLGKRTKD